MVSGGVMRCADVLHERVLNGHRGAYYFVKFILLFTTTASTRAAQQIAKIKPKIIIILNLSFFCYPKCVILNLFYLAAPSSAAWLGRLMPEVAFGVALRRGLVGLRLTLL